jgi:histidine phosphotransferase ChpT
MSQSNHDLAALVSNRICHDLISPIGAINNGLELLGMSGQALDGPEMSLIGESVMNASARIRFFRIAYGATSEHEIGRAEVVTVLNDLMGSGRLSVEWGPLEAQPRNAVRLAFLAIQ